MAGTIDIDPVKVERDTFDRLDRVDKRDKQNRIVSMVSTEEYRKKYDGINGMTLHNRSKYD